MSKPITVAVTGATGRQGGAVARLLFDRGHGVRALTRRPESAAATALRVLGVDVAEAEPTSMMTRQVSERPRALTRSS